MTWLSLLQHVPWSEVIHNAPKVVDSAKKLWDTTLSKAEPPAGVPPSAAPMAATLPSAEALALHALQTRADTLEQAVLELREQMHSSSALLQSLAEQNTQLIARIEQQSQQLRRLTLGLIGLGLLAVAALAWVARS